MQVIMHHSRIVIVDDDDAIRSVVCALAHEAVPDAIIGEHASGVNALHEVETGPRRVNSERRRGSISLWRKTV
jgi:hypothetical protein